MLKSIVLSVMFVLLVTSPVSGQTSNLYDHSVWIGFNIPDPIAAPGFNPVLNCTPSGIAICNPALPAVKCGTEFGISHIFESDLNPAWLADFNYSHDNQAFPHSAGLTFPILQHTIGIGYSQLARYTLKSPPIYYSPVDLPEGTGTYMTARYDVNHQKFILGISNALNLQDNMIQLSYGVRLNALQYLLRYSLSQLENFDYQVYDNPLSFDAGICIKIRDKYELGLSYSQHLRHTDSVHMITELTEYTDSDSVIINPVLPEEIQFRIRSDLPEKFSVGIATSLNNQWILSLSSSCSSWINGSSNLRDAVSWSVGIHTDSEEWFRFSVGCISNPSHVNLEGFNTLDHSDRVLLVTGITFPILSRTALSITYADGTSFSGDYMKNRMLKTEIVYNY